MCETARFQTVRPRAQFPAKGRKFKKRTCPFTEANKHSLSKLHGYENGRFSKTFMHYSQLGGVGIGHLWQLPCLLLLQEDLLLGKASGGTYRASKICVRSQGPQEHRQPGVATGTLPCTVAMNPPVPKYATPILECVKT